MSETAKSGAPGRIGLVGLGIMGAPLARHLLALGHRLTVWNLEPERFDLVREAGAEWADTAAEVWAASDLVFLCVLGDNAVESCCFGDSGFARAKGGAALLVDLSTTSPGATREFAARMLAEKNAHWIDAPMSGGPAAAGDGTMTLMIGGNADVCAGAMPLLDQIAGNVTRMGEVGAGQQTKILNQAIVGVNYVLMAEVLAIARISGIDAARLPDCLQGGMADSVILQRIYAQMCAGDFEPPKARAAQLNKDLKSVSDYTGGLGLDLPVLARAIEQFAAYTDAGNQQEDPASVSRLYEDGREIESE